MGISIGPSIAIEKPDFKQLNVVHLDNLLPVEQAGLVTLKGKRLSSSAKNFINSIRPYMVQV
jgi:hypothetical protein